MAVPTHMKFVVRGRFNDTPEQWSYSFKMSRDVEGLPDAQAEDFNDTAVRNALTAFHATSRFSGTTIVTGWRAYVIGTNGLTEGNPYIVEWPEAQEIYGVGESRYPLDVALCVTSEAANRGLARFGRFYLPGPCSPLDNSSRLSIASATDYLGDAQVFVKAVVGALDFPNSIQGSEMLNISAVGLGVRQTVQRLRVGRVFDSIDRRRRQLQEDYIMGPNIDW